MHTMSQGKLRPTLEAERRWWPRSPRRPCTASRPQSLLSGSIRRSRAITDKLCGQSFSAPAISAIDARLDAELARFARPRLDEARPYLHVDAREACPWAACGRAGGRVREKGVIRS
jgi:Transposase, Mutator family